MKGKKGLYHTIDNCDQDMQYHLLTHLKIKQNDHDIEKEDIR